MTRILILILLFSFSSGGTILKAQRSCGTDHLMQQLTLDANYRKEHRKRQLKFNAINDIISQRAAVCPNPVVLPMAVHFQGVTNPDAACLIALAEDQIRILNEDYQGTNADISNWVNNASSYFPGASNAESCIEFCLATQNHPTGFGLNNGDLAVTINAFTGDSNADWSGYINIFVRSIQYLGYSPLGGSGNGDGVVIDDQAFASGSGCGTIAPDAPYNLGRTLTHELGHYLNLDHIWGNGCNIDDGVADTPAQAAENYGCPALGLQSCSTNDMHMNYMDYTNDACMYMFSAGQATRMENYVSANLQNVITKGATVCAPPTCDDGVQNQDETGIDCGGSICPACPTCDDGILNQDELAIDCGGAICPPCLSCTDGIQNGDETGVDCGGALCNPCPTCNDGIQNQDETGVDCGGAICMACPTCDDGILNQDEEEIDCGGSICAPCPCLGTPVTVSITFDNYPEETSWAINDANGTTVESGGTYPNEPDGSTLTIPVCLADGCYDFIITDAYGDGICCQYGNGAYAVTNDSDASVLASGATFTNSETTNFCVSGAAPTCADGIQNGDETGIDCGGNTCPACPVPGCTDTGAHNYNPDATVDDGSCETCLDGILNGDEIAVDCGGAICPTCPPVGCTDASAHNYDPAAVADDGSCETCSDSVINGDETGVDCGGALCPACPVPGCTDTGAHNYNPDATVDDGSCETCLDGILNGDEIAVDCGGVLCDACPTCDDGIQNGDETGVDCGGPNCPVCVSDCNDIPMVLTILFDRNPQQTSWDITDAAGTIVVSGGTYPNEPDNSTLVIDICLPEAGCYDFNAYDTNGNGIRQGGYYQLTDYYNTEMANISGNFGSSQTVNFCVDGVCLPSLHLSGQESSADLTEQAIDFINASGVIMNTANVTYWAGDYILLNPDFEVELGAEFLAEISGCVVIVGKTANPQDIDGITAFRLSVNPDHQGTILEFGLRKAQAINLEIMTPGGQKLVSVQNKEILPAGMHQIKLDNLKLTPGLYLCKITIEGMERIVKITLTE